MVRVGIALLISVAVVIPQRERQAVPVKRSNDKLFLLLAPMLRPFCWRNVQAKAESGGTAETRTPDVGFPARETVR